MSAALGLEHDGLRIRIQSPAPEVLTWLAQFLTPQFRQRDELDCDHEIRLTIDRELYGTISSRGPRGNERLGVFSLDGSVEQLPVWNSANGETTVFDETCEVFCSVGADKREVLLVAAAAGGVRTHLMRVARELATNEARRRERLPLHAAALELGGRGVIIAGVKGAGKTTLLVSLLRQAGARYVSNDRVLIDTVRDPPRLRGMPTIVSIRTGTLEMFPGVGHRLTTGGYDLRSESGGAADSTPGTRGGRFLLSPARFCALLGVRPLGEVDVAMLVFPSITPELRGWRLERLRPASAALRLRPVVFGGEARRTPDLFGGPPLPDEATITRLIEELTFRVPAFDCLLGLDAHADHSLPDGLVQVRLR